MGAAGLTPPTTVWHELVLVGGEVGERLDGLEFPHAETGAGEWATRGLVV